MKDLRRNNSGQALLEFALVMPMLLIFVLGIVDFSRALYDYEVITNLAGEGSSAASRGNTLAATVGTIMQYAGSDINMTANGCVIATSVNSPSAGSYRVIGQAQSVPCNLRQQQDWLRPATTGCGAATIPTQVQMVLQKNPNQTVYITEVYYKFTPITPIGSFLQQQQLIAVAAVQRRVLLRKAHMRSIFRGNSFVKKKVRSFSGWHSECRLLILFAAFAIDMGIIYQTKARLSNAVDAAVLTGAKNYSQGIPTAQALGNRHVPGELRQRGANSGLDVVSCGRLVRRHGSQS